MKLINQLCLFISDDKPKKAVRKIKVVKKEVASVLKKEHLNATKAGETIIAKSIKCIYTQPILSFRYYLVSLFVKCQ